MAPALAHHGVAGVGAAALKGPGAPVEAASSAVLPQGSALGYFKLDRAKYETDDPDPASPESDHAQYGMLGLGYGFTPWFSGDVFLPYHRKIDEPGGYSTRGWADMAVYGQLGFKYDGGWQLTPVSESLDDFADWHFTVFGGVTLPTGNPNLRDASGSIDPGRSTGFGKPSWSIGLTATRVFADRWTFNFDLSHLGFQEHAHDDPAGLTMRFGAEDRLNGVLSYRLHLDEARRLRTDLVLEAQHSRLGCDVASGVAQPGTSGRIADLLPGVRVFAGSTSSALGIKTPVWTRLEESALQQGAEGTEEFRLILSASLLF
jgi:hypothetical protein